VIASIQTITPEGEKCFQKHGQIAAGYYPIDKPKKTLYICEGYATGTTINWVWPFTAYIFLEAFSR